MIHLILGEKFNTLNLRSVLDIAASQHQCLYVMKLFILVANIKHYYYFEKEKTYVGSKLLCTLPHGTTPNGLWRKDIKLIWDYSRTINIISLGACTNYGHVLHRPWAGVPYHSHCCTTVIIIKEVFTGTSKSKKITVLFLITRLTLSEWRDPKNFIGTLFSTELKWLAAPFSLRYRGWQRPIAGCFVKTGSAKEHMSAYDAIL